MTLMDLKNFITSKKIPSTFMVFVSKDCPFLVNQYINTISKLANSINKISSIYEPKQSSIILLTKQVDTINILNVETFDEYSEDYSQFENTIVVCKQVSKDIAENVEKYIINFPKLEEWQIYDYAKLLCPAIDDEELLWLIKVTDNNIDRIVNELDKVALFSKNEQKEVFTAIRFDPQTNLYKADLFKFVNALVDGDLLSLYDFVIHQDTIDFEPVVLANRALTSLKNIIIITQNPILSPEDCGVSAAQHRTLKYKYRNLNVDLAKQKLKFLSELDLKLKTSMLDLDKRTFINYLIANLSYKITF